MPSFKYGSRVIENEQQVRLERHVRRIGNWLQAIVNLFVTFFLFVLVNVLLGNLVQHVNLTFVKTLHLVQQSAEVLFSHNEFSIATTFVYQHSLALMLTIAFFCVSMLGLMLINALVKGTGNFASKQLSYDKYTKEFNVQTRETTVSYRDKVCFLS